jgi:hypothetical protein
MRGSIESQVAVRLEITARLFDSIDIYTQKTGVIPLSALLILCECVLHFAKLGRIKRLWGKAIIGAPGCITLAPVISCRRIAARNWGQKLVVGCIKWHSILRFVKFLD